jgi:hypothetical protein
LSETRPAEEDGMRLIENAFPADWLGNIEIVDRGADFVFVTGLPGSGLEQVAALLGGIPGAVVMREPGFFSDAVTRLVGYTENREARLEASASLKPAALAQAYENAVQQAAGGQRTVIDVGSSHLWLLGLLRAAFPAAKIVHLRRDPMDHCLDLFTTLFPRGHAWSYDLPDLARYFATCHRLMGHWRRQLPGGFLDLDYELLVQKPEAASASLAQFLGDSRATVEHFAEDVAGMSGVRGAGVGRWRSYEKQLASLAHRLRLDGVPVG